MNVSVRLCHSIEYAIYVFDQELIIYMYIYIYIYIYIYLFLNPASCIRVHELLESGIICIYIYIYTVTKESL